VVRAVPNARALARAEVAARDGQLVLAKVDVDANQDLAARYDVRGIPAVKAFRNGYVVSSSLVNRGFRVRPIVPTSGPRVDYLRRKAANGLASVANRKARG
jgi:Thioredoxin